jgi:TonB family protein
MKYVSKLAVILSLGALVSPLALSAKSVEQAYIDSYQSTAAVTTPVPVSVVAPAPLGIQGTVEVTFVVTSEGTPTEIAVKSATDAELVQPVKDAVAQWKFAPARLNGTAVARKVLLPIRFLPAE